MSFSYLPQEMQDAVVAFSDKDTCQDLSLVSRSLRDSAQRRVFDGVLVDSDERYRELQDLLTHSQGRLPGIITGETTLIDIALTLQELSSDFFRCQALNLEKSTVLQRSLSPAYNTFDCLTSLRLVSTTMPLQAFPLLKTLELLELTDAYLSGPDMVIPVPNRPRLKTLMLEHCVDPRVSMLLFNILDCRSLKVLQSTTKETVKGTDGTYMYIHNMVIDMARTALETLTLSVEEKNARREYFYDWALVPNLKNFALNFTEQPDHINAASPHIWDKSTHLVLGNLQAILAARRSKVQKIGLYFHDFYNHPVVAQRLPTRCETQPETWRSIGDSLVAISHALQDTPLIVDIRMHAFIETMTEIDGIDIDKSMFHGNTIKKWFSRFVVPSQNDIKVIKLKVSMTCSNMEDYFSDYSEVN